MMILLHDVTIISHKRWVCYCPTLISKEPTWKKSVMNNAANDNCLPVESMTLTLMQLIRLWHVPSLMFLYKVLRMPQQLTRLRDQHSWTWRQEATCPMARAWWVHQNGNVIVTVLQVKDNKAVVMKHLRNISSVFVPLHTIWKTFLVHFICIIICVSRVCTTFCMCTV